MFHLVVTYEIASARNISSLYFKTLSTLSFDISTCLSSNILEYVFCLLMVCSESSFPLDATELAVETTKTYINDSQYRAMLSKQLLLKCDLLR